MEHKHSTKQTSRAILQQVRSKLIRELSELLWDQRKPEGEHAVPEDQWEAILTEPCKGDSQLIAAVCQYERQLRASMAEPEEEEIPVRFMVPPEAYILFVFGFFRSKRYRIDLLWDLSKSEWYPEENWEQLMAEWTDGSATMKSAVMEQARKLKKVRDTGFYEGKLSSSIAAMLS